MLKMDKLFIEFNGDVELQVGYVVTKIHEVGELYENEEVE